MSHNKSKYIPHKQPVKKEDDFLKKNQELIMQHVRDVIKTKQSKPETILVGSNRLTSKDIRLQIAMQNSRRIMMGQGVLINSTTKETTKLSKEEKLKTLVDQYIIENKENYFKDLDSEDFE